MVAYLAKRGDAVSKLKGAFSEAEVPPFSNLRRVATSSPEAIKPLWMSWALGRADRDDFFLEGLF